MITTWKNLSQTKRNKYIGIFTFVAILLASLSSSDSIIDFLCRLVCYMLFAEAVNIILGFGGLRPLGQGTYFGFSAYCYLFLVVRAHVPLGMAFLCALVLTLLLSAFIGYLSLKTNDDLAFAFMNMGINVFLWTLVQKMQIVGSDTGITGAVRLPFATGVRANFYVCFAICTICIIIIYFFFHSPFATVLKGSRENLERLTFIGINTRNVRLVAYMVSSFFCAVAGLCYAMRNMGAFPTMLSSNTSLDGLIMCLIGGMYSFFGPLLGALIITAINVLLPIFTMYYQFVLGAIIVLCVLFLQGGLLRDKVGKELDDPKKKYVVTGREVAK